MHCFSVQAGYRGGFRNSTNQADPGRSITMTYENIQLETRGAVALITLNRPKAFNALSDDMMDELS